jgi:hypothetical protein
MTTLTQRRPLKKTFNLSCLAAKRADTLAFVRGYPSTSRYLEALIAEAHEKRRKDLVFVDLIVREARTLRRKARST